MQSRRIEAGPEHRLRFLSAVFKDVHFWVPLAVLSIGLLLLSVSR